MSTPLSRPKFFISATSGDLEQFRTGVADHLGRCGFAKDDGAVQRPYPTRMRDGKRIQEAIEAADVVICLIGYDYGQALPRRTCPRTSRTGIPGRNGSGGTRRTSRSKDNKRLWVFFYVSNTERGRAGRASAKVPGGRQKEQSHQFQESLLSRGQGSAHSATLHGPTGPGKSLGRLLDGDARRVPGSIDKRVARQVSAISFWRWG